MAVVDADYVTVIGYIRDRLGKGTRMPANEMAKTLAVVKDAASRSSSGSTAVTAGATACTAAAAALTAAASALTSALDVANAAIATTAAAAATAGATALTTAGAALPAITYTTSTVADGT